MDTGSAARLYSVQPNPNAQTRNPPTTTSPTSTHGNNKKRRTASTSTPAAASSGSRGVANLTPDQLAKKRANDREAQRAIRERTKTQIDGLERRIQDLTSQQPYQELQHAIRQKEQVEAENEEIKKRLSNVIGILQPLIAVQPSVGGSISIGALLSWAPLRALLTSTKIQVFTHVRKLSDQHQSSPRASTLDRIHLAIMTLEVPRPRHQHTRQPHYHPKGKLLPPSLYRHTHRSPAHSLQSMFSKDNLVMPHVSLGHQTRS